MGLASTAGSEARLWRSWQERRDGDAFASLVRPHLAFAEHVARGAGCSASDADEVVQRALVRLAEERRETPLAVGVRAWIGRSVLSESRMLARARRRRAVHESRATPRPSAAGPGDGLGVHEEVDRALSTLSERERRLVELRYLHDLDYREIAFVEGSSVLACRLRVHRAMKRLRQRLGANAAVAIAALTPREPLGTAGDATIGRAIARARTPTLATGGAAGTTAGVTLMGTAAKIVAAVVVVGAAIAWGVSSSGDGGSDGNLEASPESTTTRTTALSALAAAPRALPPREASPVSARAAGDGVEALPAEDPPIPAGKGSVAGVVRFKDGKPLANTSVALHGRPRVVAETDRDGRFRIEGEWVGAARDLSVVGPHDYALCLGPVAMRVEERVRVDLEIDRGHALSLSLRDVVTRAPIADAQVTLRRPRANIDHVLQAGFGFVKTDEDGRARFDLVPDGEYSLSVTAAGHEPIIARVDVRGDDVARDFDAKPARVLVLRLTGVPKEAADATFSWDITSEAAPDVGPALSHRGKAKRPASGEIRVDAPPVGRYHLTLAETEVTPTVEQDFEVEADAAPVLEIAFHPGSRLEGLLVDAEGRPVSGARVLVGQVPAVATDALGRFVVVSVGSGTRYVRVAIDSGSLNLGAVVVPETGTGHVTLRLPGSAAVVARFAETMPWSSASLALEGGEPIASVDPDLRGNVRFPFLASGTYRFRASAADADPVDRTVVVVAGREVDLGTLHLVRRPAVPVRVVFPPGIRGAPTVLAYVERRRPDPGDEPPIGRIEFDSDADGRGWLRGLPAGEYELRLQVSDDETASAPTPLHLVVREGITSPVEIVLREYGGR